MAFELPQSFRDERWAVFEQALAQWLNTRDGRFAIYWAERERCAADTQRTPEPESLDVALADEP